MDKSKNLESAKEFYNLMNQRRTIRHFSNEVVSVDLINECIKAAGTAPSGANKQPWYFAVVTSPEIKKKIRVEAEKEEHDFYNKKASESWLKDLEVFNTNWEKPHLEEASALIVIFSKSFNDLNKKEKCYYPKESVGISTGILITALHQLGISTLTHTPSPMKFLNPILDRPNIEKPFLILAVGYKNEEYSLPNIQRKAFEDICGHY